MVSVIVYDGITMASDSQMTSNDGSIANCTMEKIFKVENGGGDLVGFIGGVGYYASIMAIMTTIKKLIRSSDLVIDDLYKTPNKILELLSDNQIQTLQANESYEIILVSIKYPSVIYSFCESLSCFKIKLDPKENYAIGSGKAIAMGALFMGANSVQAVEAAIKHNDGCSGVIQTLAIPDF